MAPPKAWRCPYCQQMNVLTDQMHDRESFDLYDSKAGTTKLLVYEWVCLSCGELTLEARWVEIVKAAPATGRTLSAVSATISQKQHWKLRPDSAAKPQPDYIPQALRSDYAEACRIVGLSPKASATLARRVLQGMIRDFHGIVGKKTLNQEIDALKDKVDSGVWDAIDGVRRVGNIGAHMEGDINVIVDVEADEAQLLISLVEQLLEEWYVARHDRQQRMAAVKLLANKKDAERKGGPKLPPSEGDDTVELS